MDERNSSRLPDRWLNCPKVGSMIADTFLPFKAPLDERYRKDIRKEDLRWEPSTVVSTCEARGAKLGLIVDLSYSKRFYKPEEFTRRGIVHKKIACRGHNETPDEEAIRQFINECSSYLETRPDRKIGVHCTHGFNRTGFLICAYLVEQLNWNITAAVIAFREARKPGIYKPDYIASLASMYGDEDDLMPETAPRPTWEDSAMQDDAGEGVKRPKAFMSGIPGVSFVEDADETREIQRMAAEMCGFNRSGFPGSQPVSMDSQNLSNLTKEHHVVSWKADGTRYMMVIAGRDRVYFVDRDNAIFQVAGLSFPSGADHVDHLERTLLDGEMVLDKDKGKTIPRYLIYDIVSFENFPIRKSPYSERLECMERDIVQARVTATQKRIINVDTEPIRIRVKQFFDVSSTEKLVGKKFQDQIAHEIDGLVFQPSAKPYQADRCPYVLKWKPPELNTIDFLLKVDLVKSEGLIPEKKGFLFVGGLDSPFSVLAKMTKEESKLNKKIVECRIQQWIDKRTHQPTGGWVILRERTDKSFPNGYETAMGVTKAMQSPITKDYLINFTSSDAISDLGWRNRPVAVTHKRPNHNSMPSSCPKRLRTDD